MADLSGADGGLRELALFAGAGGGILGGKLLGWRTVCAVERDPYAASVLAQRQNDGILAPFPIWDDVRTFDGRPWRGVVDVVSGGFPCQDISVAGTGKGIDGERSGLWGQMFRIVCEVRPRFVFVENSPALTGRGLGRVLGDLASVGFDAQWGVLGADDVGAPHKRERIWIVANARGRRCSEPEGRQVEQQGRAETISSSSAAHTNHDRQRQPLQSERELRGDVAPNAGSNGEIRPLANADGTRQHECAKSRNETRNRIGDSCPHVSDSDSAQGLEQKPQQGEHRRQAGLHDRTGSEPDWPDWEAEPDVGRVADELADGLDIFGETKS